MPFQLCHEVEGRTRPQSVVSTAFAQGSDSPPHGVTQQEQVVATEGGGRKGAPIFAAGHRRKSPRSLKTAPENAGKRRKTPEIADNTKLRGKNRRLHFPHWVNAGLP